MEAKLIDSVEKVLEKAKTDLRGLQQEFLTWGEQKSEGNKT
jgi:hypothetical protein